MKKRPKKTTKKRLKGRDIIINGIKKSETAEQSRIKRITGIEPAYPAWEAGVLPMNYIRIRLYHYNIINRKCKM